MTNDKYDGPFKSAFTQDVTGVIKQELVTYRVKNGMLRKETVTRLFNKDQTDWNDVSSIEPLVEVK